jgi:hypothetical protein
LQPLLEKIAQAIDIRPGFVRVALGDTKDTSLDRDGISSRDRVWLGHVEQLHVYSDILA